MHELTKNKATGWKGANASGWLAASFVIALLIGCSHPSRVQRTNQTQGNPMVPRTTLVAETPPSVPPSPPTAASQPQAESESASSMPANAGSEVASTSGSQSIPKPKSATYSEEPIAEAIVSAMLASIQDRRVGADGITHIGLGELRNQSRASREEYAGFVTRLADILTRAAHDASVVFVPGEAAGPEVQYVVQGTAYIVTFEGFDLWELYLSLSPTQRDFTLWSAHGPVYVMRLPRPGQPQMLIKKVK